jgi:cysteinyl-tRNA synthetase
MSDVPPEVEDLVRRREEARRSKDFVEADALRERIRAAGFEVIDAPSGATVAPSEASPPPASLYRNSADVPSVLEDPPRYAVSVQWVVQGWPEDVVRGIEACGRHGGDRAVQHVVVDLAGGPTEWPSGADVIRMPPEVGWGTGRNAALRRSAGEVVLMMDGSVEAAGDVFGPVVETLDDPTVGVTGPFGIVTDDLHQFRESDGPDVDAVEGYFMAVRRTLVERGLRFDERFKFYRTADIELSFQVKAMGLRAIVTPVPVARHEHRMWANTSEEERARLSKRNFYRFLDRWRGRTDLLVSSGE